MEATASPSPDGECCRERIIRHVETHPGACLLSTAAALGVDWSTVEYHARALTREARLIERRAGHRRLLFLLGTDAGWEAQAFGAGVRARLMTELDGGGPVSASRLARDLGLARTGVARHLRVLEQHGLVTRRGAGKAVVFAASATPVGPGLG